MNIAYRCPKAIVNLVNPLTFTDIENTKLIGTKDQPSGNVQILSLPNETEEAIWIANSIASINSNQNIVVICNWLGYLEKTAIELNNLHIPFVVAGGSRVIVAPIKLVNHCLRILQNPNSYSSKRISRYFINYNDSQTHKYLDNKKNNLGNNDNLNLPSLISEILDVLKSDDELYFDYIIQEKEELIINNYIELSKSFSRISDLLFACSSKKNDLFSDFYERNFKIESKTKPSADLHPVTLSTIHSSKGLEWDNVFIASMNDDMLPSYKSKNPEDHKTSTVSELINEDKKKYYVAVTRCINNLFLTFSKTSTYKGKTFDKQISRFIISKLV